MNDNTTDETAEPSARLEAIRNTLLLGGQGETQVEAHGRRAARQRKQIAEVRTLLVSAQGGFLIDSYTFALWGLVSALWLLCNRRLFSAANFPNVVERAIFEEGSFAAVLVLTAMTDVYLARRRRIHSNEGYPFIRRQIGRLSLVLAGLGMLAGFGTWFMPWATVIFIVWTAIIGIILFVHGLFSLQHLEWAGLALVATAVAAACASVSFEGSRWLLVAVCGWGLPSLGLLSRPLSLLAPLQRLLAVLGWAASICLAAYLATRFSA